MKFLLSLSFLLFAAASSISASSFFAEHSGPTPILDVTGAPLQFGIPYYMAPAIWAWGGGVTLEHPTPSQPCPKLITTTTEVDRGTPVVFSNAPPRLTGNINIQSELIINFYNLTRPNDGYCSGWNLTTWVVTRTGDLGVRGEDSHEMSFAFKLSQSELLNSYLLKPVIPFGMVDFVIGFGERWNLVAKLYDEEAINLSFVFREAKNTEEDEDDRPVIIQMPRQMSV